MTKLCSAVAVALVLLITQAARAWDNFETHPRLANAALAHANAEGAVDSYLLNELGLRNGIRTELTLREGYGQEFDREFTFGRFERSLNLLAFPPFPFKPVATDVRIDLGDSCTQATQCDDAAMAYGVAHLIRAGTFAEDNPNPRARHHFHDPVKFHAPPDANRGLDNDLPIPVVDTLLPEILTLGRGGTLLRTIGGSLASLVDFIP